MNLAVMYPDGMVCGQLIRETPIGYEVVLSSGWRKNTADMVYKDKTFFIGEECMVVVSGQLYLGHIRHFDLRRGVLVQWETTGSLDWIDPSQLSK